MIQGAAYKALVIESSGDSRISDSDGNQPGKHMSDMTGRTSASVLVTQ